MMLSMGIVAPHGPTQPAIAPAASWTAYNPPESSDDTATVDVTNKTASFRGGYYTTYDDEGNANSNATTAGVYIPLVAEAAGDWVLNFTLNAQCTVEVTTGKASILFPAANYQAGNHALKFTTSSAADIVFYFSLNGIGDGAVRTVSALSITKGTPYTNVIVSEPANWFFQGGGGSYSIDATKKTILRTSDGTSVPNIRVPLTNVNNGTQYEVRFFADRTGGVAQINDQYGFKTSKAIQAGGNIMYFAADTSPPYALMFDATSIGPNGTTQLIELIAGRVYNT